MNYVVDRRVIKHGNETRVEATTFVEAGKKEKLDFDCVFQGLIREVRKFKLTLMMAAPAIAPIHCEHM